MTKMSGQSFDSILDQQIYYFMELKRLYELQVTLLQLCEGRLIKNDLIYQQMLFASFDGLFVRLDNFGERILKVLNVLKCDHLDQFKRNKKLGLTVDPKQVVTFDEVEAGVSREVATALEREMRSRFDEAYDKMFPGVKARGEGRPNHADFDRIAQQLRDVLAPIKAHRDTVVAHWDETQEPATLSDLKKAMEHLEDLFGAIYYLAKLGTHTFELGGIAADIKRTAKELAELILGEYRVRAAKPEDMREVYLMGFDVWADGQTEGQYLDGCGSSPKYARGKWYVLEDKDGISVSSLITYEFPQEGGKPAVGLGSIATKPSLRKQGLAGRLIWDVLRLFHNRADVFYLYADISPDYYEHFDFVALPDRLQTKTGSIAMIRCQKERREALLASPDYQPPGYF